MPCPLLLKGASENSPASRFSIQARELAMRVLEYGRCGWKEPDDRGVPLWLC